MNIGGQPAEIRFTLEITRKETGLTEAVEMVGHIVPEPESIEGDTHGCDPHDSGA